MATKTPITPEILRQSLRYKAEEGRLFWMPRTTAEFASEQAHNRWLTLFAGKPAFTSINVNGYPAGRLMNAPLLAHRVAWAITYDEWPKEIDHINGNRADYRIANLRAVTRSDNARNRRLSGNNTTGVMGVYKTSRGGRYEARIEGVQLGTFDTMEAAVEARRAAEKRLHYHPNHGRD